MEKRNFKIVVMIAVVISCMLLNRGAVAFASSNEQVKRNVNEIVRILKETGRTEGLCKRLDYNLYTPNGPIETWIAYIESSNTLRMSMSHTTAEGVFGDIWIEYYIDRNQAEPGWVMLTSGNTVAILTSDDRLNMATAYEDNMNLSWKQSGKYVSVSTAQSVNSIFGFSLNVFNTMLNNLFGMQLGDIGFARYPSNIPEYVAPKEEVKAVQEEKPEEKQIEKAVDEEDDVNYDNSSDYYEYNDDFTGETVAVRPESGRRYYSLTLNDPTQIDKLRPYLAITNGGSTDYDPDYVYIGRADIFFRRCKS